MEEGASICSGRMGQAGNVYECLNMFEYVVFDQGKFWDNHKNCAKLLQIKRACDIICS